MNKNNTDAYSPCAKFNYFQLTYSRPINCITIVWTYGAMRSTKIKDISGQENDDKDQTLFTIYFE